jgi:hypothetical protein
MKEVVVMLAKQINDLGTCTLRALSEDKWCWNCLVLYITSIRVMKIVPWALML